MSWFRPSRPVELDSTSIIPEPPMLGQLPDCVVGGACSTAGCTATDVYLCSYVDSRGISCGAQLCRDHIGMVTADGPVCRRHDLVAQAIATSSGSLFERVRPNIEDRRYALLLLLVSQMNERMLTMLRERYADVPGADATVDMTVRPTRRGTEVAWERGWSAFTPSGNVVRVALRVEKKEPPPIQVFINQRQVAEMVPDWILQRPAPGQEQPARDAFAERLLDEIRASLSPTIPTD